MQSSAGKNTYSRLQSKLLLPSIPALDGIRAIGVLLVILYHLRSERTLPFLPALAAQFSAVSTKKKTTHDPSRRVDRGDMDSSRGHLDGCARHRIHHLRL